MFSDDFLNQLKAMKSASEEGASRLKEKVVVGSSGNGLIKLKLDGNYGLQELKIATDIQKMEVVDLEGFLGLALKHAIEQVNELREKEMLNSIGGMF